MTMMQKIQAKKSKKGFTLVELVIVIAILAILAAIAIPVITTTINSSKLSTMKSDKATLDMLIKEAINTSKASIYTTKYNNKSFKDNGGVTVKDVLIENNITEPAGGWKDFFTRKIGSDTYTMKWKLENGAFKLVVCDGAGKQVDSNDQQAFGGAVLSEGDNFTKFSLESSNGNNNNGGN